MMGLGVTGVRKLSAEQVKLRVEYAEYRQVSERMTERAEEAERQVEEWQARADFARTAAMEAAAESEVRRLQIEGEDSDAAAS